MKTVIVVLTVISLALGVGFFLQNHRASLVVNAAEASRDAFSNSWLQAKVKLEEVEKVATTLETKLTTRTEALAVTANDLAKTSADLAKTSVDLAKIQADYDTAQVEMKKQLAKIAELETQRDDLTKKMDELTVSITSLETKITETKQKLAASEGDRKFLLTELTRLQNEKETLVAQFNSLAALRTQVAKLREEAAVSQRLAWMQMGVYNMRDKKGAERLLATTPASVKPESRLEIELQQNGRGKPVPNSTGTPNDQ